MIYKVGHDSIMGFNPYAPLEFWSSNSLLPEGFLGDGGIYNFKARFKWAILNIKAKITLLQFFGHISLSYGLISKFKKQAYSSGPPLSIFGALGA